MNTKRILIVDDDKVIANIYENKFQAEGYQTEQAGDGETALQMVRKATPDLVLLDLFLPGMNGLEVLKSIRSRPETKAVPVIVFSNLYLASMTQAAWNAGATKCLAKASCGPRDVLEIVGKVFAADRDSKVPGTVLSATQPVMQVSAPSADAGSVSPTPTDTESQIKMAEAFLANGPATIAALRHRHQAFVKHQLESLRLIELYEMYQLARSLTSAAGVIGFRRIAQLAGALEALLRELYSKPTDITPSTVRTTSQAMDTLAFLVANAGHPQAEAPPPPMILAVDDDIVSREMILSALKRANLQALSLDNSALALQVLEQNHFDLIFLDVEMPEPGGIEVCERLRRMPSNLKSPVVFVTANSDFESRARSSLSGGNDFIAKPFLLLELAVKALTWLLKAPLYAPAGSGAPGTSNKPLASSNTGSEESAKAGIHPGTAIPDAGESP